jgi:hypothetical protein
MPDPVVDPETLIEPAVRSWISDLSDLALAGDGVTKKVTAHAEAFKMIETDLDLGELRKGMTYSLTEQPNGAWGAIKERFGKLKTMDSLSDSGDAMKEIDTWHDLPGLQGLPPEDVNRVIKAFEKTVALRDRLLKMKDSPYMIPDGKGGLMEDKRRIAEDLFMPLVRQGVMPENAVPDAYSEVARTFKGASESYNARLEEYSKDLTDTDRFLEKAKVGFSVTKGLLKMASGGAAVVGNVIAFQDGQTGVNAVMQGTDSRKVDSVRIALDNTLTIVTAVETGLEKGLKDRDVFGVMDSFTEIFKTTLIMAMPGAYDQIMAMSAGIKMAVRSGQVAKLLAEDPVELDKVFKAAGGVVAGAMGLTKTSSDDLGIVQDTAVLGKLIGEGFTALGGVAKGIKTGNPRDALAGVLDAVQGTANTFAGQYLKTQRTSFIAQMEIKHADMDPAILQEMKDYIDFNYDVDPVGMDDLSEGAQALLKEFQKAQKEALSDIDQEKISKEFEEFQNAQAKALLEFRNTPDPQFELLLATGLTGEEDDDPTRSDEAIEKDMRVQAQSIETMIKVIQKDQASVALARQIVTGGAGFVASLLPGAGIVAAGADLAFAFMDAVRHHEQLKIWRDNLDMAKKAGTVQADAILNRFGLQTGQAIEADVIVLLKAVNVVAQAVKTAGGPLAPVGDAMIGATKVVEGAMEVAKTVKTEVEMAKAWKVYRRALATPQDRKLAREALQKNPTLAKYAMAYGALVEKNPVAIQVMKSTGLNEVTLASPGTNVDKVVTYLETLYKDDPILLRAVTVPQKWHPKQPADLTAASWTAYIIAAKKNAAGEGKKEKQKVVTIDGSAVTAALGVLTKARAPVAEMLEPGWVPDEKHADIDPALFDPLLDTARKVADLLQRVKALDKDGKPHKEFLEYCGSLQAKAQYLVTDATKAKTALKTYVDLVQKQKDDGSSDSVIDED